MFEFLFADLAGVIVLGVIGIILVDFYGRLRGAETASYCRSLWSFGFLCRSDRFVDWDKSARNQFALGGFRGDSFWSN